MKFLYVLLLLCLWQSGSSQVINLTDAAGNPFGVQLDEINMVRPLAAGGATVQYGDPAQNLIVQQDPDEIKMIACGKLVLLDIKEKPGTSKVTVGVLIPIQHILKHVSNPSGKGLLSVRGPRNKVTVYETVDSYNSVAGMIEACFTGTGGGGGGVAIPLQRIPFGTGPSLTSDLDLVTDGNSVGIANNGESLTGKLKVGNATIGGDIVLDVSNGGAAYRYLFAVTDSGAIVRVSSPTQPFRVAGTLGNRLTVQPDGSLIAGRRASTPYLRLPGTKPVSFEIHTGLTLTPGNDSQDDIASVGWNADTQEDYNQDYNSLYLGFEHHYIDSSILQKYDEMYLQYRRSPTQGGPLPPIPGASAGDYYRQLYAVFDDYGNNPTALLALAGEITFSPLWPFRLSGSKPINAQFRDNGQILLGGVNSTFTTSKVTIGSDDGAVPQLELWESTPGNSVKLDYVLYTSDIANAADPHPTYSRAQMVPTSSVIGAQAARYRIDNMTAGTLSESFTLFGRRAAINNNSTNPLPGTLTVTRPSSDWTGGATGNQMLLLFGNGFGTAANDGMSIGFRGNAGTINLVEMNARLQNTFIGGGNKWAWTLGLYQTTGTPGLYDNIVAYEDGRIFFPRVAARVAQNNIFYAGTNNEMVSGPFALSAIPSGGASSGNVLTWNGSAWAPAAPSGGGSGNMGGVGSANKVAFFRDATHVSFSPVISLDSAAIRIGVGTATPAATMDIKGIGATSSTLALYVQDNAGAANFAVNDLGQVGFGKSTINLATNTSYASMIAQASGFGGTITVNNTNGTTDNTSTVSLFNASMALGASSTAGFTIARGMQFVILNSNTDDQNIVTGIYSGARGATAGSRATRYEGILIDAFTVQTAGTVTDLMGLYVQFWGQNAAGGTVTNAYGLRVRDLLNSGTVTNAYGLHIGDVTSGSQTLAFSIATTDASARQQFMGTTMFNSTGAPTATVHITGSLRVTGIFYDGANSAGTNGYVMTSTGTGTAWAPNTAVTDLAISGTTSPLTLTSSTGTDVTWTNGSGITLAGTSGNVTINNDVLTGKAGGQVWSGGTAPDEDVTINGTTNATKTTSYVVLQSTGGKVGVATIVPSHLLDVAGDARTRGLVIWDWFDLVGTGTVTASSTITRNRYDNGDQATLTVNLPATPYDGQLCTIGFFDTVTTLTIAGNGNTIFGTSITTATQGTTISFVFSTGDGWFVAK